MAEEMGFLEALVGATIPGRAISDYRQKVRTRDTLRELAGQPDLTAEKILTGIGKTGDLGSLLALAKYKQNQELGFNPDLPAAINIGNRMQNLLEIANDTSRPKVERERALSHYNHIGQAGKTFGFDRGVSYNIGGQSPIQPSSNYSPSNIPPVSLDEVVEKVDVDSSPLSMEMLESLQSTGDEEMDNRRRQMYEQNAAMQGKPLTFSVSPTIEALPSVSPQAIPGFAQATGGIKATEKGMEQQAQKDVDLAMNPQIALAESNARNQSELAYKPQIEEQTAISSAQGKATGERTVNLQEAQARIPQLQDVTSRLSKLGEIATYTEAGKIKDSAMRQLGMDVADSAVARKEYMSMVNNEILPLLRQTFGAQFTENEGERLLSTLGDPDASPSEKDAVLRSFIRTKMADVNTQSRILGQPEPFTPDTIQGFVDTIGKKSQTTTQGWKYLGAE